MVVRCGDVDSISLGTQRRFLGTLSASTSWPNSFRRQQVGQARPPTPCAMRVDDVEGRRSGQAYSVGDGEHILVGRFAAEGMKGFVLLLAELLAQLCDGGAHLHTRTQRILSLHPSHSQFVATTALESTMYWLTAGDLRSLLCYGRTELGRIPVRTCSSGSGRRPRFSFPSLPPLRSIPYPTSEPAGVKSAVPDG